MSQSVALLTGFVVGVLYGVKVQVSGLKEGHPFAATSNARSFGASCENVPSVSCSHTKERFRKLPRSPPFPKACGFMLTCDHESHKTKKERWGGRGHTKQKSVTNDLFSKER